MFLLVMFRYIYNSLNQFVFLYHCSSYQFGGGKIQLIQRCDIGMTQQGVLFDC